MVPTTEMETISPFAALKLNEFRCTGLAMLSQSVASQAIATTAVRGGEPALSTAFGSSRSSTSGRSAEGKARMRHLAGKRTPCCERLAAIGRRIPVSPELNHDAPQRSGDGAISQERRNHTSG